MLITKSTSIKLFLGLLLSFGCKSKKQADNQLSHLPFKGDGFYYRKDESYSSEEYLLLKFYNNGNISELAASDGMINLNADSQKYTCLLDELSNPPTISYRVKGDSIFFKKKAWTSYEYANLYFACKSYRDSIVAQITPVDYFDTLNIKLNIPPKRNTFTYKFKYAICDTSLFGK